jgi:putative DNA primase/helicase
MSAAADAAAAFGHPKRVGRNKWRSDCPVHGGHSLDLTDGRDGRLLVYCWGVGCDRIEILRCLRDRGLSVGPDRAPEPDPRETDREARKLAFAKQIIGRGRGAAGTPVEKYLISRGITIALPVLRFVPNCPHPNRSRLPAMVARITNVDGELIGIHRTFLRPDGSGKADVDPQKAMLGLARGGAVWLAPAAETLMVAEGIENGAAAMQSSGMPAWAALSTSGMIGLILPAVIRTVVILADNDIDGAGERAARTAAQRWLIEGRRVRLAMPPVPGTDFNDVIQGRGYARNEGDFDARV